MDPEICSYKTLNGPDINMEVVQMNIEEAGRAENQHFPNNIKTREQVYLYYIHI